MQNSLLIVDDEETILHAVRRYFTRRGYTVDCARELEEAEALTTFTQYDLAIVDLSLGHDGGTEGLEVVRHLRRYQPRTRMILLTANGTPALQSEALRRGCDAFLTKPKSLSELATIASSLIGGAR